MDNFIFILLLAIAGPLIGSLIGVFIKPSEKMVLNMMAFAAGTMLAVSFIEMIPESISLSSPLICSLGIITGVLIMYFVDKLVPHLHVKQQVSNKKCKIKSAAMYIIIGIFLHNFPEGMSMAIGFVTDFKISIAIAIALAIHDIPEGICTSAPYFYCTKNRIKSFLVSATTAIPTIIGFLFAYFLYQFISMSLAGMLIGVTAGIMIFISADELIPVSFSKEASHEAIFSLMSGVVLVVLLGFI